MRRSRPARRNRPTSSFIWAMRAVAHADRTIRNRCHTVCATPSSTRPQGRFRIDPENITYLGPRIARLDRTAASKPSGIRGCGWKPDPYCVVQSLERMVGRRPATLIHRTSRGELEVASQISRRTCGVFASCGVGPSDTERTKLVNICAE